MTKDERLKILREVTKLDFISSIRLFNLCKKAQNEREILAVNDPTHVYSVDYRLVDEFEYELRMQILRNNLRASYQKYISIENDGAVLEDFVEDYIARHAYILDKPKTI